MIQFKEKGARPGARASLFTYPCLMAADILLYDTERVPVGGDQSQHVELARDLARRFNALYGETFVVPSLVPEALTTRVRDLADPARKMNKSDPVGAAGVIRLLDPPEVIRRKIRRAVTDGENELRYDPLAKPGLANLAEIIAAIAHDTPQRVLARARSYGELKETCTEVVVAELAPIRERHDNLLRDPAELRRQLDRGAVRARRAADRVLTRARDAIGLGSY
jgi:tryptophanyl-tRNA synthetase